MHRTINTSILSAVYCTEYVFNNKMNRHWLRCGAVAVSVSFSFYESSNNLNNFSFYFGLPSFARLYIHINNVKIFYRINKLQCLVTSCFRLKCSPKQYDNKENGNWIETTPHCFVWWKTLSCFYDSFSIRANVCQFFFSQKEFSMFEHACHWLLQFEWISTMFSWAAKIAFQCNDSMCACVFLMRISYFL